MTDWYISASGNDTTGNGTSGSPYATVNKIQSVGSNGDTIYVNPGTYGAFDVSKSFTLRPWPSTTGHVIFSGAAVNTHLCRVNAPSTFAIRGTYRQHFRFTNTDTTAGTGPKGLYVLCSTGSSAADSYVFEWVDILDCARIGMRVERPQGLTIRHFYAEGCGNGLSLYNTQDTGQDYGSNVTLDDLWFKDMDSMVRDGGASSDYGGVGLNLERVRGASTAAPIRITRLRTERCIAKRTGASEAFDGAGIEFFASANVWVDDWDSIDDKNCIETGTQEFGDGSPVHPKETTLASGVTAGATSMTIASARSGVGWRVGDCLYVGPTGSRSSMIIDSISGTSLTVHRAGTTSDGFPLSHSAGTRVSPAMPMDGNRFTNLRAVATSTRPTVSATSTDGHIRGALVPFMQDTAFEHCTFKGFDQFCVSMPTPIGNDFPGSTQNITFRDCIFDSPGDTDAAGQTRRAVIIADPAVSTSALDYNTWYSRGSSSTVLLRWQGSDKTSWAAVQAVGVEANGSNEDPDFVSADSAVLASTSPMIDIGTTDISTTRRVLEGAADRGGHERLLVEDTFWRTATSDMGTATDGQAWDEDTGGTSCNVADGTLAFTVAVGGTIRAGISSGITDSESLSLFHFSAAPSTVGTVKVYDLSKLTTGGASQPNIRIEANLTPAGVLGLVAAWVSSGGTATTMDGGSYTMVTRETWTDAKRFWLRRRTTESGGTITVKARLWAEDTTEPTTWDITATTTEATVLGAGAIGLQANQSSGNSSSITATVFEYLAFTPANDAAATTAYAWVAQAYGTAPGRS